MSHPKDRSGNRRAHQGTPLAAVIATTLIAFAAPASTQEWPTQTTRVIVPFAPGSTPDIVARLVTERLAKNLGRSFVVEDKPGAGGMIGTAMVARATSDGSVIGFSIGGPLVNNTMLYRRMSYDPFVDLVPVTLVVDQPCLFVAGPTVNARTATEALADMTRHPNDLNYASLGNGTVSHLVMVMISNLAHAKLTQVPYPGSGQAVTALMAGEASFACLPASNVMPQAKAGNLRILGIAAGKRSPLFPDVPTLVEQGFAGVEANAWIGVVAPAKTAAPIVARMQAEIAKALKDPGVVKALQAQLMEPVGSASPAFAAYLREERDRWGPVIRDNHIVLE